MPTASVPVVDNAKLESLFDKGVDVSQFMVEGTLLRPNAEREACRLNEEEEHQAMRAVG
jgi:hypothetical protein